MKERNIEWSAKRSVRMGMLQVDFESHMAKRIDKPKTFRLNKKEINLLQIMDSKELVSSHDLANQYREMEFLNIAMYVATSGRDQSDKVTKILSHLDLYCKGAPISMEKSVNMVRVAVCGLRKKIGSDLIDTRAGFGYHLKRE